MTLKRQISISISLTIITLFVDRCCSPEVICTYIIVIWSRVKSDCRASVGRFWRRYPFKFPWQQYSSTTSKRPENMSK